MQVTTAPAPGTPARRPFEGIFRNITSNWAALIVNTVLSFVIAPIVVNHLGSVYYGIWTLLMQFTGYLWLFDFGVRESVIKYVAQYHASGERDKLQATVQTAVSVYAVVSALGLVAVGAISWALPVLFNLPPEAVPAARIAAFLTGTTVAQSFLANVFAGVLMGLQRFYLVARVSVLFSVARSVLIYVLLTHGYGIIALSVVQFAMSLISNGWVYRLCRVHLPDVSFGIIRPARDEVKKLLTYGQYVLIANIGDKIIFATDALVIGIFLPIAALTPYAVAGTLIGHLRSFITSMASVFNPLTSSLEASRDKAALAQVVEGGCKAAMLLGLPVCIGLIMLGERFISLWMGPVYAAEASTVLTLLAIGHIVGLPYYTISGVLYGLGEHRIVAWSRIVEGAANLTLSVILIRTYGLAGVAIGTSIPHMLVVGGLLPLALPRFFPIKLGHYYRTIYLRPLLASLPFVGACWLVVHGLDPRNLVTFFAGGLLSLVAYVVPCWAVALSPSERTRIQSAVQRRAGRLSGRLAPARP